MCKVLEKRTSVGTFLPMFESQSLNLMAQNKQGLDSHLATTLIRSKSCRKVLALPRNWILGGGNDSVF